MPLYCESHAPWSKPGLATIPVSCPTCIIADLKARLETIKDLHDKYDGPHTYCRECGGLTPCDTTNAAEGKDI
jgi:hypothetical protein